MSLNEYLESVAIFKLGKRIKRSQVIQFIAYEKSGVHFAPDGKKKDVEAIKILHELSSVDMEFRDLVYYVFLSIAQDIVRSEDVQSFMRWRPS